MGYIGIGIWLLVMILTAHDNHQIRQKNKELQSEQHKHDLLLRKLWNACFFEDVSAKHWQSIKNGGPKKSTPTHN